MELDQLNKFFAGEITNNELIRLKSWLEKDPENRVIFDRGNELWQETSVHVKFNNCNTDASWMKISSRLGFVKNNFKSVAVLGKIKFRILIAAATLTCLVTIGGLSLWVSEILSFQQATTASTSTTVVTGKGEKASIYLADSTEIILNSSSTLRYDGKYNAEERVVKFSGEAFFNVKTNAEKPFIVQLEQMTIVATGTRFNVFSFSDENRMETTLEEGIIKVAIKGREPINLKTGQQVVYYRNTNEILVRDVHTETYTSWKENKLRFMDTPFEEVLRKVARRYNVKFIITDSELLDLKYTATFIDESVEDIMQLLKAVSPINYETYIRTTVTDNQYNNPKIVISKDKNIK